MSLLRFSRLNNILFYCSIPFTAQILLHMMPTSLTTFQLFSLACSTPIFVVLCPTHLRWAQKTEQPSNVLVKGKDECNIIVYIALQKIANGF